MLIIDDLPPILLPDRLGVMLPGKQVIILIKIDWQLINRTETQNECQEHYDRQDEKIGPLFFAQFINTWLISIIGVVHGPSCFQKSPRLIL